MGIKRGTEWTNAPQNQEQVNRSPGKSITKAVNEKTKTPKALVVSGKHNPVKVLSEFRQDMFAEEKEYSGSDVQISPLVVHSASYLQNQKTREHFTKAAGPNPEVGGVGSSFGRNLSSGTMTQGPQVYSPLFQMANLQLPRDRVTMNAWNRNFYLTHPLVHNCINLHSTYPISKISIKCNNAKVEDFFNEMASDMDLIGILQQIASEYWLMGEVFPYAQLDPKTGRWGSVVILNPDYIHVKKSPLGDFSISMRPDAALQRLIQSNSPDDKQLVSQMDPAIVYHVRKGNNIPLDSFHVSHMKMLAAPYDIHGTSMLVSIYKDLMLYDKLRECKFAQADGLVNPITLIKVGGTAEGEYHPTNTDLEEYRNIFESAQYDHDFKIVTHAGVTVERVGSGSAVIDIQNDMNFILDNILFGLMVPKNVITQEGAAFQSASIGLEILKQRYESFRNMMSQWLIRKIFAPISEIQEFYDYKDSEKKLIVPEIDWNHMALYDMDTYINTLKELSSAENPVVSKTTLYRSLGLNMADEQRKIKEETIKTIIFQKELAILQDMSLGALRSMKPDDDVIEQTSSIPLPGTDGAEGAMGEESGTLSGAIPEITPPDIGGGKETKPLDLGGLTGETPTAPTTPEPAPK